MRRAVLIYNPSSGRASRDRLRHIEAAAAALRSAGVEASPLATLGPGTAGDQAREAIASGCDTVFACGGDGTVHEVLQGMVGSEAAIGVIPLGTANALACDMKIPRDPAAAARFALAATSRPTAVGKIDFACKSGECLSRYFIVAAGIGADANLAYQLSAEFKRSHGMAAYYAKATHIWATHDFPPFEIEFNDLERGVTRSELVAELLAIRITDFGGILRRMAPRADLQRDDLELVLFKTARRFDYLRYIVNNMLGRSHSMPGIEFVRSDRVECRAALPERIAAEWRKRFRPSPIYAEADGEALGRIPATISIIQNGVRLLFPVNSDVILNQ
jgi:YegS/Rv2252/BmrU family lipid kinase